MYEEMVEMSFKACLDIWVEALVSLADASLLEANKDASITISTYNSGDNPAGFTITFNSERMRSVVLCTAWTQMHAVNVFRFAIVRVGIDGVINQTVILDNGKPSSFDFDVWERNYPEIKERLEKRKAFVTATNRLLYLWARQNAGDTPYSFHMLKR